jgi:zinc D-Ala-D-Ala carboxypeptidase
MFHRSHTKKALLITLPIATLIVAGFILYTNKSQDTVQVNQQPAETMETESALNASPDVSSTAQNVAPTTENTPVQEVPQWPVIYNNEEAGSVTVVVNKKHRLPEGYSPATVNFKSGSLRSVAAEAAQKLFDAALNAGYQPKLVSGYRSFSQQTVVYNGYVEQDGQANADTYSARPGHSEHQTGLAMDVGNANGECELNSCFGSTALGIWIAQNAHTYGFIIRYPLGKEEFTGYQYEPWHLRYVGIDVAAKIYERKVTLDEYFNVPAGGYN